MCWRWAGVIVTFCGVSAADCCDSAFEEQPATPSSALNASTHAAWRRGTRRVAEDDLLSIAVPVCPGVIRSGEPRRRRGIGWPIVRVMPPAATQRLEQRRGVGITTGLRLHQRDARLLVALLRAEQRQVAGI